MSVERTVSANSEPNEAKTYHTGCNSCHKNSFVITPLPSCYNNMENVFSLIHLTLKEHSRAGFRDFFLFKAALRNSFWLKIVQNQLLSKYIVFISLFYPDPRR